VLFSKKLLPVPVWQVKQQPMDRSVVVAVAGPSVIALLILPPTQVLSPPLVVVVLEIPMV
jgi:hypothetical protein